MTHSHPDLEMPALGVQQPWAELIMQGIKTAEIRAQHTRVRGPIYIYASRKLSALPTAQTAISQHELDVENLSRGMLVGTVEVVDSAPCRPRDAQAAGVPASYLKDRFSWHLRNPQPFAEPMSVRFLPYGVWFYPFERRGSRRRK